MVKTLRRRVAWQVTSGIAAALAGLGARRVVQLAWRSDGDAPDEDPRSSWTQALGWAVAVGVAVGVARVIAVRGAARVFERATGETPPQTD
jgi:anti-sigma-K factor RskA